MKKGETICIYGAGDYANKFLSLIKKVFNVAYIMDRDSAKHGKSIEGVTVVPPTSDRLNKFPVVILLYKAESAYNTIIDCGCNQEIYGVYRFNDNLTIYLYRENMSVREFIETSEFIILPEKRISFGPDKVYENKQKYISSERRVFDIVSSPALNETGGPNAGLTMLRDINEKYGTIKNFYSVCPGGAFVPTGSPIHECFTKAETEFKEEIWEEIGNYAEHFSIRLLQLLFYMRDTWYFMETANEMFRFCDDDVFIFQDAFAAQVFIKLFPSISNIIIVSHSQGTFGSQQLRVEPELKAVFDKYQLMQLLKVKNWLFPSQGAADGFFNTSTEEMKEAFLKCNIHVVHAGIKKKADLHPDNDFVEEINRFRKADILFATASFLYRHKGVERIPPIIKRFKELTGLNVLWVLVGQGEMEQEVEESINDCLETDDYVWYRKRFDNQDNIFALFEAADFYIMMQRISVWDLSTLQAMSCGCVPFLSNIAGNDEACAYGNGILVNPDEGAIPLDNYLADGTFNMSYLNEQKDKNRDTIKNIFNEKNWIDGYAQKIAELF